ncbi:uncharacterized protein LOC129799983 isoform X2 [Phlebotomus papatasi]|uniref:uncharacterized protein LOC129799983 isoform X2 n=1 Tax=Phlebotomus papatasi TaxID=29031 RepID=UPI002483B602|nr:uncharacterized protein LOC129799983 isoform X2 [Phlebotomus papatasi]
MRNTMRSELSLDLSTPTTMPLDARIAEFKEDPERMDAMAEFVDGILKEARLETEKKLELKNANKNREGNNNSVFSGLKRGRLVVSRARGVVLRIFEAICNCTNSGPVPPPRPSTPKTAPK